MLRSKTIVDTAHFSILRGGQRRAVCVCRVVDEKLGGKHGVTFSKEDFLVFHYLEGWVSRGCSKGDVSSAVGF